MWRLGMVPRMVWRPHSVQRGCLMTHPRPPGGCPRTHPPPPGRDKFDPDYARLAQEGGSNLRTTPLFMGPHLSPPRSPRDLLTELPQLAPRPCSVSCVSVGLMCKRNPSGRGHAANLKHTPTYSVDTGVAPSDAVLSGLGGGVWGGGKVPVSGVP